MCAKGHTSWLVLPGNGDNPVLGSFTSPAALPEALPPPPPPSQQHHDTSEHGGEESMGQARRHLHQQRMQLIVLDIGGYGPAVTDKANYGACLVASLARGTNRVELSQGGGRCKAGAGGRWLVVGHTHRQLVLNACANGCRDGREAQAIGVLCVPHVCHSVGGAGLESRE